MLHIALLITLILLLLAIGELAEVLLTGLRYDLLVTRKITKRRKLTVCVTLSRVRQLARASARQWNSATGDAV
jgi:hypothetical protein